MTHDDHESDQKILHTDDMQENGIRRVSVDYFHVGAYRYTDLKDAMAQAKRVKAKPRDARR